jgi:hypothetical protein
MMNIRKIGKIAGLALTASMALTGCNSEPEKKYWVEESRLKPGTYIEMPADAIIWSPARAETPGQISNRYCLVNAQEVRKIGLNPDSMCEYRKGDMK